MIDKLPYTGPVEVSIPETEMKVDGRLEVAVSFPQDPVHCRCFRDVQIYLLLICIVVLQDRHGQRKWRNEGITQALQ